MRAFKVMPKALRILAKKLTHLACNSREKNQIIEKIIFIFILPLKSVVPNGCRGYQNTRFFLR